MIFNGFAVFISHRAQIFAIFKYKFQCLNRIQFILIHGMAQAVLDSFFIYNDLACCGLNQPINIFVNPCLCCCYCCLAFSLTDGSANDNCYRTQFHVAEVCGLCLRLWENLLIAIGRFCEHYWIEQLRE